MSLPQFLQGLGSVGVFASRAFLPALVTALLLRFGPLARHGLLPHIRDVPPWFTSDTALVVLGLLAMQTRTTTWACKGCSGGSGTSGARWGRWP